MQLKAALPEADPPAGHNCGAQLTRGAAEDAGRAEPSAPVIAPHPEHAKGGLLGAVIRFRDGLRSLQRSRLTRRIIATNLVSVFLLLIAGLAFDPSGAHLLFQREAGLVSQARLIADLLEVQTVRLGTDRLEGADVEMALSMLDLGTAQVIVFDPEGLALGTAVGTAKPIEESVVLQNVKRNAEPSRREQLEYWFQDSFNALLSRYYPRPVVETPLELSRRAIAKLADKPVSIRGWDARGAPVLTVAVPVTHGTTRLGVVALTGNTALVQTLSRARFHWGVEVFAMISAVSVVISLVLGVTIARPLNELAEAAELGREWHTKDQQRLGAKLTDLTETPGEIGRLSQAMRGMVDALYLRIESNEQFAADVAHEIKNPLASLRSAVGTLRVARRDNHREALMAVIEHDVRRLDRLVTDISNASRLDSDLVKEQQQVFDLLRMLANLTDHLSRDAANKGVEMIADLPDEMISIWGLEERLAQVFVNLIGNAVSFCEEGDAVRVWVRRRENRVLVVVEDTGPGIPEQALTDVFKRFYSERPVGDFGNHSGLGLAISKQIVEAHGGVIWAENIRPTDADVTSDPLGARFVVGLPV